ncbi:MAG: recombinase family protein [Lachnospiraceae bacterium]|nr:recombinase family protein [Lachnospiraceae bacterium]
MMECICIYNRCSTEEENQKNALEIQAQESVEIVRQHVGWQIVDQFVESQSGTTSAKRSKYQQMLACIEQRKYTIVVIKSIDRLVRNTKDWYLFLDCIVRNNTRLYIYIDNKFYSPEDSLITGIKAILAEEFSRELSKKIKNAHKRRQTNKSGYNICSEMFGWNKISKDIYEVNEDEANVIRQAYELIEQGYGFDRLSKEMFLRGVRSRNQKKIAPTTWRKMLRSPRMYGTVILHRTEYDFNLHKAVQIPETEWVLCEDALPPIVSREYYQRMLDIMDKRSRACNISESQGMPKSNGSHELSGKIICGMCGNVFYRRKQSLKYGKRAVWVCSNYINKGTKQEDNPEGCQGIFLIEDVLKEFIFKAYVERFQNPESKDRYLIDETLRILRSTLSGTDYILKMKNLERESKKLLRNKDKAFEKLMDGVLSDLDYKAFMRRIDEQLQKISYELDELKAEMSSVEDMEKRLLGIKKELKQGDVLKEALKTEVIGKVQEIRVYEDQMLDIRFDRYKVAVCKDCADVSDLYTVRIRYEYVYEGDKQLADLREGIKEYIVAKEKVTLKEIVETFEVSQSRAYSRLRELKTEGIVEYERNRDGGYWYLVK